MDICRDCQRGISRMFTKGFWLEYHSIHPWFQEVFGTKQTYAELGLAIVAALLLPSLAIMFADIEHDDRDNASMWFYFISTAELASSAIIQVTPGFDRMWNSRWMRDRMAYVVLNGIHVGLLFMAVPGDVIFLVSGYIFSTGVAFLVLSTEEKIQKSVAYASWMVMCPLLVAGLGASGLGRVAMVMYHIKIVMGFSVEHFHGINLNGLV